MPGMRVSSIAVCMAAALTVACGQPLVQAPAAQPTSAPRPQPLSLKAADGATIYGLHYPAGKPKAVVLLFHQAGSGKGEYASIAPRLVGAGYSALAIDQRAGGAMFGHNETAVALGRDAAYPDAEQDLEAAFGWARARKLPIILWGSSYSAALVFRLAARHPGEAEAVLAFSPAEYLDGPAVVRTAAARVSAPVFVTSAAEAQEIAAARALLAASPARVKVQHVPRAGVHGSSTLIASKNPGGAEENWRAVLSFLERL